MSLYKRLDLTRPSRKSKTPLWERIDLTRPPRLRCQGCRIKIEPNWEFCPSCGVTIKNTREQISHCIWIDLSYLEVAPDNQEMINSLLMDAFSKVYGAFRSIRVFLTSETPDLKQWNNNFSHVFILADNQPVNYLGIATFKAGAVTEQAVIRIDQVFYASYQVNLNSNQLSNLLANTIAHEIGHLLGLDHSALPTDVMHDGLDHQVHSLMPPSFHAEQILAMNNAIYKYKGTKSTQ